MRCLRRLRPLLVLTGALVIIGLWGFVPQGTAVAQEETPQALQTVCTALQDAFNAHDARAIGDLWSEDAVHCSVSTGTELSGRSAITEAYRKLFETDPTCTLTIAVRSATTESDTSAVVVGTAEVSHPGQAPSRSVFEAKLSRDGAKWQLTSVREVELPLDAAAGLNPLGWLIGRWVDEQPTGRIVNQFRWTNGGAFLLREYWVEGKDELSRQGTQIFGWDAEQACVRTWLFDSSGSFGEGHWEQDGPRWVNKLALKLPDGRRAAVTQILERAGDNQLTWQSIDREIDGAAQPNSSVAKLTRQADPTTKTPVKNPQKAQATADTPKGDQP